jgi:hypothetical protein
MPSPPRAAQLQSILGLTDEEILQILDEDPLTVITDQLDHHAELPILLDLLAEPLEQQGEDVLRRWVRASGKHGVPVDLLTQRDFARFEDALGDLGERGFVIRKR